MTRRNKKQMNNQQLLCVIGRALPTWPKYLRRDLFYTARKRLLASFDMGAKNLACCVLNIDTEQVEHWFLIDLFRAESQRLGREVRSTDKTVNEHVEAMIPELDRYAHIFNQVTHVAIELQPAGRGKFANNKMNNLQHCLKTWFLTKYKICAQIMSATLKLKLIKQRMKEYDAQQPVNPSTPTNANKRYQYNKKRAVLCTHHIGQFHATDVQMAVFCATKKKDDYADSFLQGLYRIKQLKLAEKKCSNVCKKKIKVKKKRRNGKHSK